MSPVRSLVFVAVLVAHGLGSAWGQPRWDDEARFRTLEAAVEGASHHGLTPEDYHLSDLVRLRSHPGPERDRAANEALALLVTHLHRGKVNPQRYSPNGPTPADQTLIINASEALDLLKAVEDTAPSHPLYRSLVIELARLRKIEADGGWPIVGKGATLSIGTRDPRVAQLTARLEMSGDLRGPRPDPSLFDDSLKEAVIGFQQRMGLAPNGLVTPAVVTELNRPVAQRIIQLRVNMDRARSLMADLPARFIIINIAGFEAYLVEDQSVVWRSRVQVGKPFRQTPQLRSAIDQIVLNPTWTVPPTILKEDIAPAAAKDPGFIAQRGLLVTDQTGRPIDPRRVDWRGPLPYRLQQAPGPDNAMGRVKFLFPNPYSVFLHDTPAKSLFSSPARAFSSGCVRLERPLELANRLLADDRRGWTSAQTDAVLETNTPQVIRLKSPVTILLAYWTAWVDPAGVINFRHDIYGLDDRWAKALDRHNP